MKLGNEINSAQYTTSEHPTLHFICSKVYLYVSYCIDLCACYLA